jgi:hypothetical protein
LENGFNLLQEGEESSGEEEEGPDPPRRREATGGKSPSVNEFFSDSDFGEDFEPPTQKTHMVTQPQHAITSSATSCWRRNLAGPEE